MKTIIIWGEDFEQDIRPLIKAFYPGAEFQVTKKEWKEQDAIRDTSGFEWETAEWDYAFYLKKTEGFFAVFTPVQRYTASFSGISVEEDRKTYKNTLMRKLYRILQEITGKTLPWGFMTGVRPTKQVLEKLEAGEPAEQIRNYLREEYYCSEEKIETSLEVAAKEHEILQAIDCPNGYSIYIGIPFCPSTCYYCSFTSFPVGQFGNLMEDYLVSLMREIRCTGKELAALMPAKKLHTIYIGGGTPTTLSAEQLDRLFTCVEESFDLSSLVEMTVEAGRPDSITEEKLKVIKAHNIGRISINPQTMKQETLDLIGRRHTVEQIMDTFWLARGIGFQNINMDIILGLAKETPEDVAHTLEKIGELDPENLTVHTLAIKRAARLNTKKSEYAGFVAQDVLKMLELSREFARRKDYHPYYLYRQKNMTENLENVGYSKLGKEGIYNILIMEERQTILALGAGATSKFVFHRQGQIERVENVKNLKHYIERVDEMIERKRQFLTMNGKEL